MVARSPHKLAQVAATMLVAFAKVESEFWTHNPGSAEKLPGVQGMIPPLTSEAAAQAVLRGLRWNLPFVAAPLMFYGVLTLNYLFPPVTRWLLYTTGHRRLATTQLHP